MPRTPAPAATEDDVEVQDYALHSEHTQTARYRAVTQVGEVPVVRDLYISRLSMPNPRVPPKKVRIAIKFL